MIQTLHFLPICLQFLWIQLPLSFTTRFVDESFVSYYLTWHITPSKTHRVPSFILECSNSRPLLAKCIKQQRQKTTKACFFVNRYGTTLSRFLSFKVSRLRSLLKFQDFAVLLASPNNCQGFSCVGS